MWLNEFESVALVLSDIPVYHRLTSLFYGTKKASTTNLKRFLALVWATKVDY